MREAMVVIAINLFALSCLGMVFWMMSHDKHNWGWLVVAGLVTLCLPKGKDD